MTFCGGNRIALVDGAGRYVWKRDGHHFESLQFARMLPGVPGEQILVDIDHMPPDQSPLWVLDADGVQHGRILTRYSRHHRLIDWDGDGLAEIAVGGNLALYNHEGRRIATLDVPERYLDEEVETSILPADMTGDGVADLLVITPGAVCVFRNERGLRPDPPHPLGTAPNVTLY